MGTDWIIERSQKLPVGDRRFRTFRLPLDPARLPMDPRTAANRSPRSGPRAHGTDQIVDDGETGGVYIISVAARLLRMHPQTLRKYERLGFIAPARTEGRFRLYSLHDIIRLQLIKHLVDELGLNLAGVELVVELVGRLLTLHRDLEGLPDYSEQRQLMFTKLEELLDLLNSRPF